MHTNSRCAEHIRICHNCMRTQLYKHTHTHTHTHTHNTHTQHTHTHTLTYTHTTHTLTHTQHTHTHARTHAHTHTQHTHSQHTHTHILAHTHTTHTTHAHTHWHTHMCVTNVVLSNICTCMHAPHKRRMCMHTIVHTPLPMSKLHVLGTTHTRSVCSNKAGLLHKFSVMRQDDF